MCRCRETTESATGLESATGSREAHWTGAEGGDFVFEGLDLGGELVELVEDAGHVEVGRPGGVFGLGDHQESGLVDRVGEADLGEGEAEGVAEGDAINVELDGGGEGDFGIREGGGVDVDGDAGGEGLALGGGADVLEDVFEGGVVGEGHVQGFGEHLPDGGGLFADGVVGAGLASAGGGGQGEGGEQGDGEG